MRWAVVVVGVVWPVAAGAERVDPPGAPADAKLVGHVLVWKDATWFVDESEKSLTLKLATITDRKSALGAVVPAKVIRVKGERVEVELSKATCTDRVATIIHTDSVRFFVARKDLAPVVAKTYTATYKNGSRITVKPGTPVLPTKTAGYSLALDAGEVDVDIPAASIGYAYTPAKPTPAAQGDKGFDLGAGEGTTEVTLGAHTFAATPSWAPRIQKRKTDVVFPLGARCVDAAVVAPADAVKSSKGNRRAVPYRPDERCQSPCPGTNWVFPKGTVLRTPGGRVVARAAEDMDVKLSTSTDDTVQVCRESEVLFQYWPPGQLPHYDEGDGPRRTVDLCVPTKLTRVR